jgi:hypothetical protein
MNSSKNAVIKSKVLEVIQLTIGIFNLFMFGLVTISYIVNSDLEDRAVTLLVLIAFDMLWIMITMFGVKRNRVVRRFKQYSSIILNNDSFSIRNLSTISGEPEAVVLKNLKQMINWKFIKDAYINIEANCIFFNSGNKTSRSANTASPTVKEKESIVVTCKNCGGINKLIKGSIKECEFCNSLIEGISNGK